MPVRVCGFIGTKKLFACGVTVWGQYENSRWHKGKVPSKLLGRDFFRIFDKSYLATWIVSRVYALIWQSLPHVFRG